LYVAELTPINSEIGASPHDAMIFPAADRCQEREMGPASPQLSVALAIKQNLSQFSRLISRTPWVARPVARTCLVRTLMTLPLALALLVRGDECKAEAVLVMPGLSWPDSRFVHPDVSGVHRRRAYGKGHDSIFGLVGGMLVMALSFLLMK
jgi:hypothetical protein